ncbi:MAG TPA: hypothetical protein VGP63_05000 [Planctomycetaceae bacterium]|jgi:hypothetical protein|nr:hypothetical protein [Planctomycetaceae bacterium]
MSRLPLERIEELVEDSVFHPSPCKRHREHVLRSAVQATVRQKISRQMIAAISAAALVLGLGIVVVRLATSPGEAVSDGATPAGTNAANATTASATATETGSAAPAIQPSTAGSLGEGFYRSSNSSDPKPADGQTKPSAGL